MVFNQCEFMAFYGSLRALLQLFCNLEFWALLRSIPVRKRTQKKRELQKSCKISRKLLNYNSLG